MALTNEERQLGKALKASGKTTTEIMRIIAARRAGATAPQAPEEQKPAGFVEAVKDIPSDLVEGFQSSVDAVSRSTENADQVRADVEAGTVSPAAGTLKTIGGGLRAGAEVVGNALLTLGKVFTSPRTEQKVSGAVEAGAEAIAQDPNVRMLVEKYETLSPEQKATIDGFLGTAEGLTTMVGLGPATKTLRTGISKVADTVRREASTALSTIEGAVPSGASLPSTLKSWVQQPIPASVENVLKETSRSRFNEYEAVARKAVLNNKNATPMEVAGQQAQTALRKIQDELKTVGNEKNEYMKLGGITGFKGDGIITFRQGLQSFLNSKTAIEGDTKLIRDIKAEFDKLGDTPSAGQVDRFIDFAQERIYSGTADLTVPVTTQTTAALRSLVGRLNSELRKQLPDDVGKLNDRYSYLINIRNELNSKLGKEGEKGGALMKRVFSPSDANTKKLFAEVLDLTGIDLVNEATLARYMMDILGDARQKSMLQQLDLLATSPNPSGVLNRLVDYVIDKANSPDELIERARQLTADAATPATGSTR